MNLQSKIQNKLPLYLKQVYWIKVSRIVYPHSQSSYHLTCIHTNIRQLCTVKVNLHTSIDRIPTCHNIGIRYAYLLSTCPLQPQHIGT